MSIEATEAPASREGGPVAASVAAPTDSGRSSARAEKTREEILYGPEAAKAPAAEAVRDAADKSAAETQDKPVPTSAPVTADGYTLSAPDGLEITPEIIAEAAPVFREVGLTSEAAQKLMPLAGKVVDRVLSGQNDQFMAMKKDWAAATMSDPDLGGARWSETDRLVAKALNAVGAGKGSELRELLNQSGLGNHPAMIRAFRHFGSLVSNKPTSPATREQILYPGARS